MGGDEVGTEWGRSAHALERRRRGRFLSRVLSDRMRAGVETGVIAAAATAGALAGLGARDRAPVEAFRALGRMLLGVSASEAPRAQSLALVTGIVIHAATVTLWGVLFAVIAARLRGVGLFVAAAVFSLVAYAVSSGILPPLLRLGYGAKAFPPQLALLYSVLALALAMGMRLAQSRRKIDRV